VRRQVQVRHALNNPMINGALNNPMMNGVLLPNSFQCSLSSRAHCAQGVDLRQWMQATARRLAFKTDEHGRTDRNGASEISENLQEISENLSSRSTLPASMP
jgi:hypothetical protein